MHDDRLSWPGALVRSFSPPRLALCALGVALPIVLARLLARLSTGPLHDLAVGISHWPPADLAEPLGELHPALAIRGWLLALTLLAPPWLLVAGWIARAELCAQVRGPGPTPTAFVFRKASGLALPPVFLLGVTLFGLALVAMFAVLNTLLGPVVGALVLAVGFPALLILWSVIVVIILGSLSLPMMPAAVAAEGSDHYDAVSRSYNYFFLQPLPFALWSGLAASLATVPPALGLSLAAGDLVPAPAQSAPVLAGLVVGASVFWSLQPLVYLRLRRLVDQAPEGQIWDGQIAPTQPDNASPPQAATSTTPKEASPSAPEAPLAARTHFSLSDTSALGGAARPTLLVGLLVRLALCTLLTLITLRVGAATLDQPPMVHGPEGRGEVLRRLAEERPALLLVFAGVVVAGAALLLRSHLTYAARLVALAAVFGPGANAHQPARRFAAHRAREATVTATLFAVATVLYSLLLLLVPTSLDGPWPWRLMLALSGAALVVGAAGALGLGRLAVTGSSADGAAAISPALLDPGDLLLSAGLATLRGVFRFALAAGLAALIWWLACDSLAWFGGKAEWARWGLDGRLAPSPQRLATRLASYLTAAWFALLVGSVLVLPLADLLRWGVVSRLRAAASQAVGEGRSPIPLSPEERDELSAGHKK